MLPKLPNALITLLGNEQTDSALFTQEADLLPNGEYGQRWIVITEENWISCQPSESGSWDMETIPLKEIHRPRIQHLKGCAALLCENAEGTTRELVLSLIHI